MLKLAKRTLALVALNTLLSGVQASCTACQIFDQQKPHQQTSSTKAILMNSFRQILVQALSIVFQQHILN